MNLRLPTKDSSTYRGVVTGFQAVVASFIVFSTGLLHVIHGVPGCYEQILSYVQQNAIQAAVFLGVPTGIASLIWNVFVRKDVANY